MKIRLPNGDNYELNESFTIEEKIEEVNRLTDEWMQTILSNWSNSDNVKYFLDSLANYLVWHKEEDSEREDKEVMSRNKTNRLHRGRKDILFSDLGKEDKEKLFGERGIDL